MSKLNKTLEKIQRNAEIAKQRKAAKIVEEGGDQLPPQEKPKQPKDILFSQQTKTNRGRPSNSVIEQAQLNLFRIEEGGGFVSHPIKPDSSFPTFLTRIPIFVPGLRHTQSKLLDQDNALPFNTSWAKGRKHGPPLTIYDEDTLIAIGRLRQKRLIGEPSRMPVPVAQFYKQRDKHDVSVHVLYCMLTDIQRECDVKPGGKNNELRIASIKRLAATTIELEQDIAENFVNNGTNIKLIDVVWQEYTDNAVLFIQFTPIMARWFDKEYTFINLELRRKLSDPGKAIHRYLSSHKKNHIIGTKKLMSIIGYPRPYNKFLVDLRTTLKQLSEEKWLVHYSLDGNGRTKPYVLTTIRA